MCATSWPVCAPYIWARRPSAVSVNVYKTGKFRGGVEGGVVCNCHFICSFCLYVDVSDWIHVTLFRLAGFTKRKNQNYPNFSLRVETPLTTFYKRNHKTKISVITREILIVIVYCYASTVTACIDYKVDIYTGCPTTLKNTIFDW